MHIVLTDITTCPRCGPEFGLVILADRIEDRHVREGSLGCANCRTSYPVRGGVADLRWPPEPAPSSSTGGAAQTTTPPDDDEERPFRLAALLGVTEPGPPLLISGQAPGFVRAVQGHVPDAGVVGIGTTPPDDADQAGSVGMGWVVHAERLPFRDRSISGVALTGGATLSTLVEALRCLRRGARLVIDPAPEGIAELVTSAGGELLLQQGSVAVAFNPLAG